jgi:hypothetical protein
MTQFTLTLLAATGIQEYIFSSNRLQENIGASEIVSRATTLWAFKALEKVVEGKHNIKNGGSLDWEIDESKHIEEDSKLMAEVIQAAGGNTVVLFRDEKQAHEFVQKLTFKILKDAPGLTVLAQHDNFDFDSVCLPDALKALHEKMQKHKLSRRGSSLMRGLGVTAICDSTGLPAVTTLGGRIMVNGKSEPLGLKGEDDSSLISAEAAAKRGWRQYANERLNSILKNAADGFTFPYDLEKIGRNKGEESYIAVIHADGNRMGARVREIGDKVKTPKDNRPFIKELRAFSKKINDISQSALESVVGLVVQAVKHEDIPFVEDEDGKNLPFRPLVFGGDDVTFVCSGLIGVSLAAAYIEAFEIAAKKYEVENFHASAGISIVKMHYPFARAYSLAEELTASAKTLNRDPEPDCSAIDWHFAQSGLSGSLEMIRRREYTLADKSSKLNLRPLTLSGGEKSWQTVKNVMSTFKTEWADQHNKVIALREVLRKGNGNLVRDYLQDFDLLKKKLPEIKGVDVRETGWQDGVCYYFDAIELLDHYVALDQEAKS